MKKLLFVLVAIFTMQVQAQEIKQIPMINVSGEGKIKVAPDQVSITISVETKGALAADVKKENDQKMDAVLKFIKKSALPKEDYQTQRVTLNPNYDYEKKKQYFLATQSINLLLKDLSKYDLIMEGLVNNGVNRIASLEFKTSKMEQYQSEARKLAVKDAKAKAEDFVSVLNQKVGRAISISDASQNYNPQPIMYARMKTTAMADGSEPKETLASGEIEILVNVNVSFSLD